MISHDDIAAMHPEYDKRPSLPHGNSLLGLCKVIKALEADIDTGTKTSMGYAASWHVSGANRKSTRD